MYIRKEVCWLCLGCRVANQNGMKLLEITVAVGKREILKKMWKLNALLTNISDKKSQGKLENILRQIEIKTQDTKIWDASKSEGNL